MEYLYYLIATILIVASILPIIPNQHMLFRIFDFGRIQILVIQVIVFLIYLIFLPTGNGLFWFFQTVLLILIFYGLYVLIPYTRVYPVSVSMPQKGSRSISILSINVHQFNKDYIRLITLVREIKPDLLLTMESNQEWENALAVLEDDYIYQMNVPRENTYGMHLYSKLEMSKQVIIYFMADDIPSIEAKIKTTDGHECTIFGVHPPPPSPTEEIT